MAEEVWKPISGYEGLYDVSNFGRVRSYKKGKWGLCSDPKIITGQKGKHYITVTLCRDGTKKSVYIHRLVADSFVPNAEKHSDVNHKDGNKLNNNAENLEWCTHRQNMEHAERMSLMTYNKKAVVCCDTNVTYCSITDAASAVGISRTSIDNCLNGRSMTAGGYCWKYAKEGTN